MRGSNTRKFALTLFVVLAAYVTAMGWVSDYRSCLRAHSTNDAVVAERQFLQAAQRAREVAAQTTTGVERHNDLAAARAYQHIIDQLGPVHHLSCFKLLPDTG